MAEGEMNRHQRGMVDGCFEEGHYQQGISYLDQLRMQNLRPSPAHIRQLMFIALYPPPPRNKSTRDKGKRKEQPPGITSPSKQHVRRLQKQIIHPPPEASEDAWKLLHEFSVSTNSPESLLRAVPCYPLSESELANMPRLIGTNMFADMTMGEDPDSFVAKNAACLKECSDCWSMLRADVVVRQDTSSVKIEDPFLDVEAEDDYEDCDLSSAVVGKHSWRLLTWFVGLFERDQALVEPLRSERYSIYLLSQIKPVHPSYGETRSNTDSALEVVFTCYSQSEIERRELGRRLMSLLVGLTSSRHFSPSHFLTSTSARLQACSNEVLWEFLSGLPHSGRGLAVKLAICDRFLTQNLRGIASGTEIDTKRAARTKSQARRARPIPVQKESDLGGSPTKSQIHARIQDNQYPWTLPTSSRVLHLLKPESGIRTLPGTLSSRLIVLYHLVEAFGILRAGDDEVDQSWTDALQSGQLQNDVKTMFSVDRLSDKDKLVVQPLSSLLTIKCLLWS
ncbi:hypothetical protein M0805_001699 [Coniferiporia weirii]|nr:hypothetical protein M0805_001699 [Coniferiporia weirii]